MSATLQIWAGITVVAVISAAYWYSLGARWVIKPRSAALTIWGIGIVWLLISATILIVRG